MNWYDAIHSYITIEHFGSLALNVNLVILRTIFEHFNVQTFLFGLRGTQNLHFLWKLDVENFTRSQFQSSRK